MAGKNWIAGAIKKKGSFTKTAAAAGGISKETGKIKPEFIAKAKKSGSALTKKRAVLAETLGKLRGKK